MHGKRLAIVSTIILGLALVPAQATIVDDVDPVAQAVHVGLVNPDPALDRGYVKVVADVGGPKPETQQAPYMIDANGDLTVIVGFSATVQRVLETQIIDSAEPF